MKTASLKLCVLLLIATFVYAESDVQSAELDTYQIDFRGRNNKHSFLIHLEEQPFQRSRHRITGSKYQPDIDGQPQEYLPLSELSRFEVVVDGRHWQVPPWVWRDCFDPILRPVPDAMHLQAMLSRDGKVLRIKMFGGDAVGSYDVTWLIKANGQSSRKVHSDFAP